MKSLSDTSVNIQHCYSVVAGGRSLFHQFLRTEYGEESLDFWEAVEDYRKLKASKLAQRARELYDEYITIRAPREVRKAFLKFSNNCVSTFFRSTFCSFAYSL